MKRVVITGMGALTPIGNNINDYWTNLKAGTSGSADITRFDTSKFKTHFGCELKNFNIDDHIPRSESRKYDRFTSYALIAVA